MPDIELECFLFGSLSPGRFATCEATALPGPDDDGEVEVGLLDGGALQGQS